MRAPKSQLHVLMHCHTSITPTHPHVTLTLTLHPHASHVNYPTPTPRPIPNPKSNPKPNPYPSSNPKLQQPRTLYPHHTSTHKQMDTYRHKWHHTICEGTYHAISLRGLLHHSRHVTQLQHLQTNDESLSVHPHHHRRHRRLLRLRRPWRRSGSFGESYGGLLH